MQLIKNLTVTLIILTLVGTRAFANNIVIKQVLKDGIDFIDGLDNPRQVQTNLKGDRVFVTSADDNSLLVLQFDGSLKPLQVFKNSHDKKQLLEGASSLVSFNKGQNIAVASFYDSALSIFEKSSGNKFKFSQALSDNVSYHRIFKSNESLSHKGNYGLFGAWDIATSEDKKNIYVASYKSNAISIFDIKNNGNVTFNHKYTPKIETSLGNPTSIVLPNSRKELIVAGFENNTLTVHSIGEDGGLSIKQTIQNGVDGVKNLVSPQKIILSPNERYLYVACSGSKSIVVFELKNNHYLFLQSITHANTGGKGLNGVGSIAITNDGSQLFTAGEMDEGLLLFHVLENGQLQFNKSFQTIDNKIEGVTSIAVINEGMYVLLTLGKMDALYLLKLRGG